MLPMYLEKYLQLNNNANLKYCMLIHVNGLDKGKC